MIDILVDRKLIMKAKETLGDRNAIIMAEELGLEDFDEKNLKACCCFHEEETPSLIFNPKNYTFHCFGCQKTVDIIDVFMMRGLTYLEAVEKLFQIADIKYSFGEARVKTKYSYKYPKRVQSISKDRIYQYFQSRCISKKTVDYVGVDEDSQGNIVFNYYDVNDVLTMVKYRVGHKVAKGEIKCWCQKGADTTPLLFNMNRTNTENPLLICEGECDAMAAIESGFLNAVSVPFGAGNFSWIEENWDWLELFDSIIVCSDNDESGLKMQKELVYRLGSWRTKYIDIPPYIERTTDGEKVIVKDLNEVLFWAGKDKVLDLILNAKDAPVPSVKDLSDIDDVDFDTIEGICTGISGIDKELIKLFYGTLTLVSGTPGSGKTSFLYQIICQALDQGKNCWLFSKELPEWMTKNWFNYILAGRRNIKEYKDKNSSSYYRVTPEAKREINNFYKGRWFVYRDDCPNKLDDLIASMTDVVRKYGVKLLVLDNMMTIDMEANADNEFLKQTETIKTLIHFCTVYNVAVVLVAHPRKVQNPSEPSLYDISGSSNVVNLVHRTIWLRRVPIKEKQGVLTFHGEEWEIPPNKYDMMFCILKDRIRGRANFQYGLYYDEPSRRFFSNVKEFEHNYQWDKTIYKDHLDYPIMEDEQKTYDELVNQFH